MAAGYTIASAGVGGAALGVAAATTMAIPVVGCVLLGGVFLAGVALACVAGLANNSFLDTAGVCHIDLDKQKLDTSATEYVPHVFQNCFPCITDKAKITNREIKKDNNGTPIDYTYDDQLQYLPMNFINYLSITANDKLSKGYIRQACQNAVYDKEGNCKLFFKDSWAERLNADSRINTTDTYYLLPLCTSDEAYSDTDTQAVVDSFLDSDNPTIVGTSDLLTNLPLKFKDFKNNPFFNQPVVSTVLNYPIFNQAMEIHFSKAGKLQDLLEKDYDSLNHNGDINAFCGTKTLSGIDPKTGNIRYLKLSNGAATTTSETEATKVAQVFVVYRKRDYVPIKAATSKTYWDTFKSGYSFYSTIDDSTINYSTKPDLLVGCYRQETNANDNSITAE